MTPAATVAPANSTAILPTAGLPRVHAPLVIKRVLLVYPFSVSKTYNVESVLKNGHFIEAPIGLGYIASFVKKFLPEIEIEVFDANAMAIKHIKKTGKCDMDELFGLLKKEIADRKPDVVGVSCLFDSIAHTAHLHLAAVREVDPRIVTVMGGNYPTGVPKVALSDENLDFIIFSEGEQSFSMLLIALREGIEPTAATGGIAYDAKRVELKRASRLTGAVAKQTDEVFMTEVIEVPKGKLAEEIDDYPNPDRSGFDMTFYATESRHTIFRTLPKESVRLATLTASRGCPFKCTFCSSKDFWGQTIRYRNPKLVVDEMAHLHEAHGINTFVFNDDNIMFDRKEILALCEEIKRRGLKINWMSGGGIQVTAMKNDVIQAVVETGLRQFNLAIETGNAETLHRIKKPLVRGIAEQVIAEIRKYPDTWISSNFITGFYFEKQKDIEECLAYAGALDLDWRCIYSFQPLRGTEDYKNCVERGYLKDSAPVSKMRYGGEDSGNGVEILELTTENFTADFVRNKNYEANLLYNFVRNRNYGLRPKQVILDVDYVTEMVPDHALGYYAKGRALREMGQLQESLVCFEKAARLVAESEKFESTSFKSMFAMTDAHIRWHDYCDKFGVDMDAEVAATKSLIVAAR